MYRLFSRVKTTAIIIIFSSSGSCFFNWLPCTDSMKASEKEAINSDQEYVLLCTAEPNDSKTDSKLVTITEFRDHEHATT